MKKYIVIGKPIDHSLSPQLHNYWIKQNNINAIYGKEQVENEDLKELILKIKKKEIDGINVTVPYKNSIIPNLDELTPQALSTQSVNTIYAKDNKIVGHNTDVDGFEASIRNSKFNPEKKEIFIIGAGGVVPSIIFALNKMKVSKISLSNRTKDKALILKNQFKKLDIIAWGDVPNFDMIINATSVGLNKKDNLGLNFSKIGSNKFFYDVIYNPQETNFLKIGNELGNEVENGKMMFIYQAWAAFKVWHGIEPKITNEVIKLLDK